MVVKKTGLGRGLDILLSSAREAEETDLQFKTLPIEHIKPGTYQPRMRMEAESLQELAASLKAQGMIQPVVVRKLADHSYELVAGERR